MKWLIDQSNFNHFGPESAKGYFRVILDVKEAGRIKCAGILHRHKDCLWLLLKR